MLITKEVEIRWNPTNKKRFVHLGYGYTKMDDLFTVNVEQLSLNNKSKVDVTCDYCGNKISKSYDNYLKERSEVEKDSCYECRYRKEEDVLYKKQKEGTLKKDDRRYYFIRENRLQEVDNYIKSHNTLDGIYSHKSGRRLCDNIRKYGDDVYALAIELGYRLNEVTKKKPSWYYEAFNTLKRDIVSIIDKYESFPSLNQLMRELNISNKTIDYHGGIHEIRKIMGYEYNKYLDNNGFYNSSSYETIVANYLISQGLGNKYKREQSPFPKYEGNYRSDFTFYLEDDKTIHCEVWGLSNDNGTIADAYNEVRQIKENLYRKHSLDLISIEPSIFSKSYKEIDRYLHGIFKKYFNLKFEIVNQENLIPSSLLTDEELLHKIMQYSDDKNCLPTTSQLRGVITGDYNEIIKRYGNYQEFGVKFDKKVEFASNGYWTKDSIFKKFDYMILEYGRILNRKECKDDLKLNKFSYIIQGNFYGGFILNRLEYLKYLQENNRVIPECEIKFLYDISRNNSKEYSGSIDENKINIAQKIMNALKKQGYLSEEYYDFIRPNHGQDSDTLNLIFDVFMYMTNQYGEILSEYKYNKLKKDDEKLREVNPYKRIQRGEYNLVEVKDLFGLYLNAILNKSA